MPIEKKPFEFKNIADLIDWYFSTAYSVIEEKHKNPFHRKIVLRTVRGIHKGLLYNVRRFGKCQANT